ANGVGVVVKPSIIPRVDVHQMPSLAMPQVAMALSLMRHTISSAEELEEVVAGEVVGPEGPVLKVRLQAAARCPAALVPQDLQPRQAISRPASRRAPTVRLAISTCTQGCRMPAAWGP